MGHFGVCVGSQHQRGSPGVARPPTQPRRPVRRAYSLGTEVEEVDPEPWFGGQVNPPFFHTIKAPIQTSGLREWAGLRYRHRGLCRRDWPRRSQGGMRTGCSGFGRRPPACGPEQSCCVPTLSVRVLFLKKIFYY